MGCVSYTDRELITIAEVLATWLSVGEPWAWSEEEDDSSEGAVCIENLVLGEDRRPMNHPPKADTGGSDNDEESSQTVNRAFTIKPAAVNQPTIFNLVLRMRNSQSELNDIRFEFEVGKDSAEGIASNLVGAGLVDPHDSVPISVNLSKLLGTQTMSLQIPQKMITFHLNSTGQNEQFDDKALVGFAQISIVE